jgi:hypothetical protein
VVLDGPDRFHFIGLREDGVVVRDVRIVEEKQPPQESQSRPK